MEALDDPSIKLRMGTELFAKAGQHRFVTLGDVRHAVQVQLLELVEQPISQAFWLDQSGMLLLERLAFRLSNLLVGAREWSHHRHLPFACGVGEDKDNL